LLLDSLMILWMEVVAWRTSRRIARHFDAVRHFERVILAMSW
jgi:hypothetical protein